MERFTVLAVLVVALVGAAPGALADAPDSIGYQGLVLDASGLALPGPVELRVEIYDQATDGSLLYGELHTGVVLAEGVFNVSIGTGTLLAPFATFDESVFDSPDRYVEVRVNDEIMSPRQRLDSVPYALQARVSETASSVAEGSVTNAGLAGGIELSKLGGSFCVFRNGGSCPAGFVDDAINLEIGTHTHDMCPGDEVAGDSTFVGSSYCSVRIRMCCK